MGIINIYNALMEKYFLMSLSKWILMINQYEMEIFQNVNVQDQII